MYQVLHEKNYKTENLVQTRSQAICSGIKLPEVHGAGKNLDPNLKPQKKQHANPIKGSIEKPHIGQGRAGFRRKNMIQSIKLSLHHQNCCRKFLDRQK